MHRLLLLYNVLLLLRLLVLLLNNGLRLNDLLLLHCLTLFHSNAVQIFCDTNVNIVVRKLRRRCNEIRAILSHPTAIESIAKLLTFLSVAPVIIEQYSDIRKVRAQCSYVDRILH